MEADILLLRPRGRSTDGRIFAMEQLGLSYIAASARVAGMTAEIIDGALEPDRYGAVLAGMRNDAYTLIGYPIYPETVQRVARDVGILRSRGITTHVTVGNHLATLCDRTVLTDFPQFDSALRGEGEEATVELAISLRAGSDLARVRGLTYRQNEEIRRNPPRPNLADLDALPFPARDTLPLVLAAGNVPLIYSSRGCNARCDFCSVHNYFNASPNGGWRGRSPSNVVDEMEFLCHEYDVREFAFADEQFLGHGRIGVERALGIAEEICRRALDVQWYIETRASGVSYDVFAQLREAGLSAVFMGLESGYDPALKQLRKGLTVARSIRAIEVLKALEILPSAGFIMFRPDTTMDELRHNLDFLAEAGCIELTALVTIMRVYSGTGLEARLRSEKRLRGTYYDYEWSFQDARVRDCYLVAQESADTLSVAYNEFARFRRRGLITYPECLKLQRVMNLRPIQVMQEVVEAVARDGRMTAETRSTARAAFVDACDDFLHLLRFVEAYATHRQVDCGVRLLSPMYLC
jgi:anaerobic magnesium-protoporphyrin IX monomethyl ester cyclase